MPKPTLTERVRLFTDSEIAGGADKADLAKSLKNAAKTIEASAKPASPPETKGDDTKTADTKGESGDKPTK